MLKHVKITNLSTLEKPKFLNTQHVVFTRDGEPNTWEMVKQHDSVHVIVQNTDSYEILLVKQVRIPVLVNNRDTDGAVIECCAGIIDGYAGSTPSEQARCIARDEVRQELGYEITEYMLEHIQTFHASVGTAGSTSHAYYAEVTDDMFIGQDLSDNEDIEVIRIPVDELELYIRNARTDAVTLFLTQWLIQQ